MWSRVPVLLVLASIVGTSLSQNVAAPLESRIIDNLSRYYQMVKYQDAAVCFPLNQTWFMYYRTNENNMMFGGNNSCVRMGRRANSGMKGLEIDVKLSFGKDHRRDLHIQFDSANSPLSDRATSMEISFADAPNGGLVQEVTVIYANCEHCMVLRHTSSTGFEESCSLFTPASEVLGGKQPEPYCEFIYLLLCGNSRYGIFEDCCTDDGDPPPYTDSPPALET